MTVGLGDVQVNWVIVAAGSPVGGIHVDGRIVTFNVAVDMTSFGNGSAHFPGRPRLAFQHLAEWCDGVCKLTSMISEL